MIDTASWMAQFTKTLDATFPNRVWFVGLQGSYSRDEATDTSDIDPVVILEEVTPADIQRYSAMLDTLPHRELICGFLSGKREIFNWEPSDLFQFCHDTNPIRGSLDDVLALADDAAITRAIKIGVCNIYHGCIHNMLHGKCVHTLRGLYKSASFTAQAICYRHTGRYIRRQEELLPCLDHEDRKIVATFLALKNGAVVNFREMSEDLVVWAGNWIEKTK